jgi:SAM-dependent methyltransferase
MTEISAKEVFGRRLPVYAYLEPLLVGRSVLEVGAGVGTGVAHLAARGAATVVGIDTDPTLVERARAVCDEAGAGANVSFRVVSSLLDVVPDGPFDIVLVPEAESLLRRPEAIPALGRLLAPGGRLILVTTSADRRGTGSGGVGYYELADALVPHFSAVQMFGVTPFAGFGVVEFDAEGDGLRVDSRLADSSDETPSAYVAVAGGARALDLGYALVQVPFGPIESKLDQVDLVGEVGEVEDRSASARLVTAERRLDEVERRGRARAEEAEGRVVELRRKVEDAAAESASSLRIVRAQGEEIEELRARLRRAAEDRAQLDGEVAKLRHALADADESVMSLTRKTAEEMSAVAARLAATLRAPVIDTGAGHEEAQRLKAALGESEARASAAEQRLEEVGSLGRERQAALDDVMERLRQAEEMTARERKEVARLRGQLGEAGARVAGNDARETALATRDERIVRLEGEKQELTWRLAELEEKLRKTIGHSVIADKTGRVTSDELDAARASRSRAMEEFHRAAGAHVDEVTSLRAAVSEQTALVAELEDAVRIAEAAAEAATADAASLRKNSKGLEEADRARRTRLAELEGKLLRLEHERKQALSATSSSSSSSASSADSEALTRDLAAAGRERDELRGNLARVANLAADAEDALAKVTAELVAARGRAATLEGEVGRLRGAAGATNGHDHVSATTARELSAIEAGLRDELATLAALEGALEAELVAVPAPIADRVATGVDVGAGADAILLHTTLGNYRRHAARLRDELEGVRRRLDSLSPSEISGYLEELGEDLAEMEE